MISLWSCKLFIKQIWMLGKARLRRARKQLSGEYLSGLISTSTCDSAYRMIRRRSLWGYSERTRPPQYPQKVEVVGMVFPQCVQNSVLEPGATSTAFSVSSAAYSLQE